jgi:hypothetical protein
MCRDLVEGQHATVVNEVPDAFGEPGTRLIRSASPENLRLDSATPLSWHDRHIVGNECPVTRHDREPLT